MKLWRNAAASTRQKKADWLNNENNAREEKLKIVKKEGKGRAKVILVGVWDNTLVIYELSVCD